MEQNLPVIAKKIWSLVRVMFYMLRKGIAKRKFLVDLNMMIKRGKIAGKALHNLMFQTHHHHNFQRRQHHHHQLSFPSPPPGEYEFSCSNTPRYPLSLFSTHKKHHAIDTPNDYDDTLTNAAFTKALEMLTGDTMSPAQVEFGKSPMVKQLRITDSPFPLSNCDEDGQVDEAAEKFIMRFYNDLRRQN